MPEPLPLADLLAALRDQGLPVGVREHLAVGRLLAVWDETDVSSLRGALGAVLGRNPDEVRIVGETFDRLYGGAAAEPEVRADPSPAAVPPRRRLRWGWIAGLTAAGLALLVILGAILWPREIPEPDIQPLDPQTAPLEAFPPSIPETVRKPDWGLSFTVAAGAAVLLFLWLFGVRRRDEARSRARRRLIDETDALPGPYRYEISLETLAPPFSRDLLDDAASLLGRRTTIPPRHGDIDAERTLARTLRAGLAPHIVLRARASTHPILVLEDVGSEMRPWRRRVSALLDGLEARGVPLDRWRFHADAGRVFRDPGAPPSTLKQLFRLRAESPLLVISTGEGLLEKIDGWPAAWVEVLQNWRYRAWLHPVTDPLYWRPALQEVPVHVWPMTAEGVMAASRQLIHGETGRPENERARALPQRRVGPLDVERLRWLLTLAPRRDPDLAELLRQRFCPQVSPAALLEALDAPPLASYPGIGPTAGEVHTFLAGLLASSEPRPGTAAHERWRLDLALQQVRIPDRKEPATQELMDLAQRPLAAEVVSAVERMTGRQETALRKQVLRQAFSRAGDREARRGWRWTWPDATEIAAALVCLGILGLGLPLSSAFQEEQLAPRESLRRNPGSAAPAAADPGPLESDLPVADMGSAEPLSTAGSDPVDQAPLGTDLSTASPVDDGLTTDAPNPAEETAKRERLERIETRLAQVQMRMRDNSEFSLITGLLEKAKALHEAETIDTQELEQLAIYLVSLEQRLNEQSTPFGSEPIPTPPAGQSSGGQPTIDDLTPSSGEPGDRLVLSFTGRNFDPKSSITFGIDTGISVSRCEVKPEEIRCEIEISPDAAPGPRDVSLYYPDRKGAVYSELFTVLDRQPTGD